MINYVVQPVNCLLWHRYRICEYEHTRFTAWYGKVDEIMPETLPSREPEQATRRAIVDCSALAVGAPCSVSDAAEDKN